MRRSLLSSICLAAMALCGPALASQPYPAGIQDHLGLSYLPPCSVCHDGGKTGIGTVNTPFGQSMRAEGLVANDEAALTAALDALDAAGTDSDADTVADIDELVTGNDPNRPDKGEPPSLNAETPTYGCGAHIVRVLDAADLEGVLLLLALLIGSRVRRRSRHDPCSEGGP